jgi:hypothetical protein
MNEQFGRDEDRKSNQEPDVHFNVREEMKDGQGFLWKDRSRRGATVAAMRPA